MKRVFNIIFPGLYGLLVYATVRLLQDIETGFRFWKRPVLVTSLEAGMSILVGCVLIGFSRRLCARHDKMHAGGKLQPSLLLQEIVLIILANLLIVNLTFTPLAAYTDDGLSIGDLIYINIIPSLYALIYYGYLRSSNFLNAYIQQQLLVGKLTNDRLETELKFLKAQYHPHFLFNALNTVYFQMEEDVPGARQSIEKLSALLRYQLYDQGEKVSMKQELEYLQNFIALQKVRSTDRLNISIKIDEHVRSQLVYPLLFLPLIENAFKYVGGDYRIDINLSFQYPQVVMKVENSIPGTPASPSKAKGIGLENLERRLALLYPGKHHLRIEKKEQDFLAQMSIDIS